MANLIMICGPQAVGKMTVAESLRDKLRYNMMINHDSVEVSDRIFGFATPAQKEFNAAFRKDVFDIAVRHDVDLIFTYLPYLEMQEELDYIKSLEDMFTKTGGSFYLIELHSDVDVRIQRNETPHRLQMKKSKNDLEWSRNNLLNDCKNHKLNSDPEQVLCNNHLKIDNTALPPDQVADMVIARFGLKAHEGRPEKEYRYGTDF